MESKKKYEVVYVRLYPKQKEDLMNKIKKSGLDLRSYIIINLGLKNE